MTGQEMRDYIVQSLKRDDKDDEIYEAIKDTLLEVTQRHSPEELKEEAYTASITALGQYKLALPTDFGRLIGDVRVEEGTSETDAWPLAKLSKERFDELYPNQNATNVSKSKPEHYCIFRGYILLGPVPDKLTYQYELSYSTGTQAAITAATDPIPLATKYREMIKAGTLKRIYIDIGNDAEAAKWSQVFEADLAMMIDAENKNTGAPMFVRYRGI